MTTLSEIGTHDWRNYLDYWRDEDATWLQARSVLRVNTPAELGTKIAAPGVGQMVYVKDVAAGQTDVLFMYASKTGVAGPPGWIPYPALPKNLYASEDSTDRVTFGHHPSNPAAVVPSVTLSPTGLNVVSDLAVKTDVLKVTATNMQFRTSTKTVVLTTDTVGLVSDSSIRAPGFISTGAITATGQTITAGSITATSGVTTGTLNATGASTLAAVTAASLSATAGLTVSGGKYLGNASGAVIQGPNWVAGNTEVRVYAGSARFDGGSTIIANQPDVYNNVGIRWFNGNPGTHFGWLGPVVYSGSDPGGPNGTIWVIP
jgi:hypothetical protein